MNKEKMKKLLQSVLSEEINYVEYEEATWGDKGDGENNLSPRGSLLASFKRRLQRLSPKDEICEEVEGFLKEMGNIPSDVKLYSWVCKTLNQRWVGWATGQKVIYKVRSGCNQLEAV